MTPRLDFNGQLGGSLINNVCGLEICEWWIGLEM